RATVARDSVASEVPMSDTDADATSPSAVPVPWLETTIVPRAEHVMAWPLATPKLRAADHALFLAELPPVDRTPTVRRFSPWRGVRDASSASAGVPSSCGGACS